MGEVPYIPYLPPEHGGWKRRFEITIPILLLILVFIVVAWKMGWLCNIPVLDALCAKPGAYIFVVGEDNAIATALEQMKVGGAQWEYEMKSATELEEIRTAEFLKKYDLIILTESAGTDPTYLSPTFRTYLKQYLDGGGKMLLFGVAGSRDPSEPNTDGWTELGNIPVRCRDAPCRTVAEGGSTDRHAADALSLKKLDAGYNHPILKEFGPAYQFTGAGQIEYAIVNVYGGTALANLEVTVGAQTISNNAIVEGAGALGTKKVIYFAYHPAQSFAIFENAIKYLTGG